MKAARRAGPLESTDAGRRRSNDGPPTEVSRSLRPRRRPNPRSARLRGGGGRKCQSRASSGSAAISAVDRPGSTSEARLYASEVTISRWISFIRNPRATNSAASQSRSRGLLGSPPSVPKSLGSLCRPSPKCHCQSRLTATRANIGLSAAVSQSEKASTRPSRNSTAAGANGQPGATSCLRLGPVGVAAGQDVALLELLLRVDLDGPEGREVGASAVAGLGKLILELAVSPPVGLGHDRLDLAVVDPEDREIVVGDPSARRPSGPSRACG